MLSLAKHEQHDGLGRSSSQPFILRQAQDEDFLRE